MYPEWALACRFSARLGRGPSPQLHSNLGLQPPEQWGGWPEPVPPVAFWCRNQLTRQHFCHSQNTTGWISGVSQPHNEQSSCPTKTDQPYQYFNIRPDIASVFFCFFDHSQVTSHSHPTQVLVYLTSPSWNTLLPTVLQTPTGLRLDNTWWQMCVPCLESLAILFT